MGKLETDSTKVNQREHVVRSISQQSLTRLLKGYREKAIRIMRAALVVGIQIDPAEIANPHIRAHAPRRQVISVGGGGNFAGP
jgi:hypothetical protein